MRDDDRDFDELTVPEQILRVQDLWDRIEGTGRIEITPEQREELERRLRAHEEIAGDYTSWRDVRARLGQESR